MRQNTNWDQVLNLQKQLLSKPPLGMVVPRPKTQNWARWQDKYASLAQSWRIIDQPRQAPVPVILEGAPLTAVWYNTEEGKGVFLNPSGTHTLLR